MTYHRILCGSLLALAVAVVPALALAQDADPNTQTVELFQGMKDGKIDVQFIPKNAEQARLLVTNKTKQPLNVKLPEAFAGVPVLAQGGFGGGGLGGAGGGGQQGLGGGFGGGGGGLGGQGGGGGGFFMNVAPEKVGQVKVGVLCLEHGKPDPSPAAKYEIKPIEEFTQDKAVQELCKVFGSGKIPHASAQAAAWHLANQMSWQELAAKRIKRANGTSYPYFSAQTLQQALGLAQYAQQQAEAKEKSQSESLSGDAGE